MGLLGHGLELGFDQPDLGTVIALTVVVLTMLFIAGVTSSVSLAQPAIAFLEDEFNITKEKAVLFFGGVCFVLCQPAIFFLKNGVVDELDFWGGTFCLVLFATIEVVLFVWVFGIEKAWEEIHHGAEMRIPGFYKPIIKYVTPLFLFFILGFWFVQQGLPVIFMEKVPAEMVPFVLATRIGLITLFIAIAVLVRIAWYRREK